MNDSDKKWMSIALEEAARAREIDEVPIGACIVSETNELIAAACNRTITHNDPTAHAEILALRAAAEAIGNYRLTGVTVYSTIEPCAMCAGALVNARVSRLIYGADDERFGAVRSHFGIGITDVLNHQIEVEGGVMADECREMMQEFFRARRAGERP